MKRKHVWMLLFSVGLLLLIDSTVEMAVDTQPELPGEADTQSHVEIPQPDVPLGILEEEALQTIGELPLGESYLDSNIYVSEEGQVHVAPEPNQLELPEDEELPRDFVVDPEDYEQPTEELLPQ